MLFFPIRVVLTSRQDRIVYQPLTDDQQSSFLKVPTASLSWTNFKALHRHLPERYWMNDISIIFDTKKVRDRRECLLLIVINLCVSIFLLFTRILK
jgi:hypothetical protein